jgi:NADP-dependent 3-hydroxy acid dehydrogenase YdfG
MSGARLDGTVAVVTGASSGIGWASAQALAAEGAEVLVLARRTDRLTDLVQRIQDGGGTARSFAVDVVDDAGVAEVIGGIGDEYGRIDVLVNNAGFLANNPALDADLADWHRMIDVNVGGVLNVTHAALPYLVKAAEGPRAIADLVMISSVAGRRVPTPESNVYAASKHAVVALSEALRQELSARRVRVSGIEPGVVRTEMTTSKAKHAPDATIGDPLHPEDIAEAIAFAVTRPARVSVNEILIRPTEQTR